MAYAIDNGGIHRVTDPGIWTPNPPGSDDTGIVETGVLLVINQPYGSFLDLAGAMAADASVDAVGATFTGGIFSGDTFSIENPPTGEGMIGLAGSNIIASGSGFFACRYYLNSSSKAGLNIALGDVVSRGGLVIQQAKLTNDGGIDSFLAATNISSTAQDAEIVNNGEISIGDEETTITPAIAGTGTIAIESDIRGFGTELTLDGAVGAGQSISFTGEYGLLHLGDPGAFRGTIAEFNEYGSSSDAMTLDQRVTSAPFTFDGKYLTLYDGTNFVGQIKFYDDFDPATLSVFSGSSGTELALSGDAAPAGSTKIKLQTAGAQTIPALSLPTPITKLPTHGPDLTPSTGATVASIDTLIGYTPRPHRTLLLAGRQLEGC